MLTKLLTVTIPAGQTTGTLTVTAPANTPAGDYLFAAANGSVVAYAVLSVN